MAKLQFGPTTSAKGFTSHETSSFNDLQPARIVRELIQNSLDAAVEIGESTAMVRFQVDNIGGKEVPDLKGYRDAFKRAVKHWQEQNEGKLTDPAQQVADRIEGALQELDDGKAAMLSVLDNGVGLDTKRMNSLMSDGGSGKQYDLSGSYGVGHLAPVALSDIRYMLYGGVTTNGTQIACGRTILASHPGEDKLLSAEGYLIRKFRDGLDGNLYEFLSKTAHPKVVSDHLKEIRKEWGHGCAVIIPGYNNFRGGRRSLWDIISKVAAYNFCTAINRGKLIIDVCEGGAKKTLSKDSIESILEAEQDRTRAARSDSFFEGLRPSGQNAYSIFKTLTAPTYEQTVDTDYGVARINLLLPSIGGQTRVDLFRNGMWITDEVPTMRRADFANRQPFHAVIEIDAGDDSKLHRLVRKAEGPMHDKLSLSLLSKTERDSLEAGLETISEWIRGHVPGTGEDEYTVDDFLLINTDPEGKSGAESFSFWGIPIAVSRRGNNQRTEGTEVIDGGSGNGGNEDRVGGGNGGSGTGGTGGGGSRGGRRGTRERRANPLSFRSVVVPDAGKRLNASLITEGNLQEALLRIRVDENTDFTCDRIWPDEDVSITSFSIDTSSSQDAKPTSQVMQDERTVKVQGISGGTHYDIQIEYDVPVELSNTVEIPVFRLELLRPPSETQSSTENQGIAKHADGN